MPPQTNSQIQNKVPIGQDIIGELVPLRDLVYVEPDLIKQNKTASGIIIQAPKRQGVPNTGVVRYIGPDVDKDLKIGDKVVVNDANMRGFHVNGVAIVPLEQDKIIAIIKETK